MSRQPLFAGLIVDEDDQAVTTAFVGTEPCYVVDDAGFRRHIPSEQVDRQVLDAMMESVKGHEDIISEQTAKMLGQEDLFSRAVILNQLKKIDQQFDALLETGLNEEVRAYLGMMGFRVVINLHGEVLRVDQPGMMGGEEGGEE